MKKPGKAIRHMGYIRDQEGIMNRYLRESAQWKGHLERTRRFISDSFSSAEAETVAVLGSGWLLDVPLEDLCLRFRHVFLVDIHHPMQIRKRTAAMDRVELVEADLTGGAVKQVWDFCHHSGSLPGEEGLTRILSLHPPLSHIRPDALISVNLLNQLDIILCDYIRKQRHFQQGDLRPLRAAIQAFHVNWVSQKPSCLVSDILEEVTDNKGTRSSKALLHTSLPPGIRSERWWWDFDSQGTYHPGSLTRMEVQAIEWG